MKPKTYHASFMTWALYCRGSTMNCSLQTTIRPIARGLLLKNWPLRIRAFGFFAGLTDRGLSPAVIEGFLSSSSDYVGVIDADLQHDPAILPQMIAALDAGAEIAVGSRYVEGGGTGTWNAARRFQSWVATKLAQTFLGVELTDPMSGYFILRRGDFNRIHKQLDSSGFKILLEIIARLAPSRLEEIPYTFRDTRGWPIEVVLKSRSPVPGTTLEALLCQPLHVRSLR